MKTVHSYDKYGHPVKYQVEETDTELKQRITSLENENRELMMDKERLDWLERELSQCAIGSPSRSICPEGKWHIFYSEDSKDQVGDSLRDVIDKATTKAEGK